MRKQEMIPYEARIICFLLGILCILLPIYGPEIFGFASYYSFFGNPYIWFPAAFLLFIVAFNLGEALPDGHVSDEEKILRRIREMENLKEREQRGYDKGSGFASKTSQGDYQIKPNPDNPRTIKDYKLKEDDYQLKEDDYQLKEDDYQLKEDDYQLKEDDDIITDIIQDRATRQAFGLISGKLDARFEVGVLKLQEEVEVWLRKIRLEKTLKEKEIDNLLMKTKDLYDPFIKVQYVLSKILFDKGDKEKKANILKIHQCKILIRDFIKKGDEDFQEFVKKIQEDLQKYEEKLQKTQSTRGIELPIFLIREIWMNELYTQSLKSN